MANMNSGYNSKENNINSNNLPQSPIIQSNSNNINLKYNPFARKDKIAIKNYIIAQSPASSTLPSQSQSQSLLQSTAYYIPNTPVPCMLNKDSDLESITEILPEPGSSRIINKFKKRRRSSNTLSQPEGQYSPMPKSKILNEFQNNLFIQNKEDEMKEMSPHNINNSYISRARSESIRAEVLKELEKMDNETTNDIQNIFGSNKRNKIHKINTINNHKDKLKEDILKQMKRLEITQNINNQINNRNMNIIKYKNENLHKLHNYKGYNNIISFMIKYCFNKDLWLNTANNIFICLVLMVYWNIISAQFKL